MTCSIFFKYNIILLIKRDSRPKSLRAFQIQSRTLTRETIRLHLLQSISPFHRSYTAVYVHPPLIVANISSFLEHTLHSFSKLSFIVNPTILKSRRPFSNFFAPGEFKKKRQPELNLANRRKYEEGCHRL